MKITNTIPALFLASAFILTGCGGETPEPEQNNEQSETQSSEQSTNNNERSSESSEAEAQNDAATESNANETDSESTSTSETTTDSSNSDEVKSGVDLNSEVSSYDSPYLDVDFSAFKENVENDSLIDAIDKSAQNYQDTAVKIIEGAKTNIKDVKTNINSQIEEGQKVIQQQQAVFDENCQDIQSEKQSEQCNSIGENIHNTEQRVESMKVDKENRIGEINTQKKNQLGNLKTQFVNNINKKRTEEGLEAVDPFDVD